MFDVKYFLYLHILHWCLKSSIKETTSRLLFFHKWELFSWDRKFSCFFTFFICALIFLLMRLPVMSCDVVRAEVAEQQPDPDRPHPTFILQRRGRRTKREYSQPLRANITLRKKALSHNTSSERLIENNS